LRDERGWTIEVARKTNVYGSHQDVQNNLRLAYDRVTRASRHVPGAM